MAIQPQDIGMSNEETAVVNYLEEKIDLYLQRHFQGKGKVHYRCDEEDLSVASPKVLLELKQRYVKSGWFVDVRCSEKEHGYSECVENIVEGRTLISFSESEIATVHLFFYWGGNDLTLEGIIKSINREGRDLFVMLESDDGKLYGTHLIAGYKDDQIEVLRQVYSRLYGAEKKGERIKVRARKEESMGGVPVYRVVGGYEVLNQSKEHDKNE